jgi:ADP-dependent NAD(P)H-hydrate dehydratase / NAD(P)H-hydrate epimerase
MSAVDRYAIQTIGIPGAVLMESAGRSVYAEIRRDIPETMRVKIAVVCGPGNNGGDGFVIARYLTLSDASVDLFLIGAAEPKTEDSRRNLKIVRTMGLEPKNEWNNAKYDLIVDALFGIGLERDVREPFASVIRSMNENGAPIYAVDIPSGLNADTGEVMGAAICAEKTITFGFPKKGFYLNEGPDLCGEVRIADISLKDEWLEKVDSSSIYLTESSDVNTWFPKRKKKSHKNANGHVLVLAGSPSKSGAAVLAAQSALRAGAGLVTLATPKAAHTIVKRQLIEAMSVPLPSDDEGRLEMAALTELEKATKGKQVIVMGPGLEPHDGLSEFLSKYIEMADLPVVLDASGLTAFGNSIVQLGARLQNMILTPHPGEMAGLIGSTAKEVQKNRIEVARDFSAKTSAIVVLKGANTVIALPNGEVWINPTGNPAMATAGTGDVLAGIIGSYIAQGLSLEHAAIAGVFHHGLAGDRAANHIGPKGIIASDLISELPKIFS